MIIAAAKGASLYRIRDIRISSEVISLLKFQGLGSGSSHGRYLLA
jgi:hypothetical protein